MSRAQFFKLSHSPLLYQFQTHLQQHLVLLEGDIKFFPSPCHKNYDHIVYTRTTQTIRFIKKSKQIEDNGFNIKLSSYRGVEERSWPRWGYNTKFHI